MAEDTSPTEGNGTPTPEGSPEIDPVTAAHDLLKSKGKHVLGDHEFHSVKEDAAKPYIEEAAALKKQLDSLTTEHAKLAEWKKEQDDAGKSESELMAQRQVEWERTNSENIAATKAAEKERDKALALLAQERVENRLTGLLVNSNDIEMSLLWAHKEIGELLSTDESGQLVWTQPDGIKIVGQAAKLKVSEWWGMDRQKALQSGNVPGPPTSGSPTPPAPKAPGKYQPNPALSQMENYIAAEEWEKKHGQS